MITTAGAMYILILIGAPGSGKGSLSQLLVKNYDFEQLSTGDLCRKHIKEQTQIGKQIDFAIKSGKLVTDSIIIEMANEWLIKQIESGKNIVLDGYPRTIIQAEALEALLRKKVTGTCKVIKLLIPDDVIIERLLGRWVCQNKSCQAVYSLLPGSPLAPKKDKRCDRCGGPIIRRSDDTKKSIEERLNVYHKHEQELIQFYLKKGYQINELDADKPLTEIFVDLKHLVGLDTQ